MNKKTLLILFATAFLLKLSLFAVTTIYSPEGKIELDSPDYISTGLSLANHGVFAREYDPDKPIKYEAMRTPGYPLFVGFIHGSLKLPLEIVVFFQILLTLLAGYITYLTAVKIDPKLGLISALIVLFDPPTTTYSLMIMTESLFLVFIALFMFLFALYLKDKNPLILILAAVVVSACVYIRPIALYLRWWTVAFLAYLSIRYLFKDKKMFVKTIIHALIFVFIANGLIGLWYQRNKNRVKLNTFTVLSYATMNQESLYKSYSKVGEDRRKGMGPVQYYVSSFSKLFLSLMTRPGTIKYFNIDFLRYGIKVVGYPFMAFWLLGLIFGLLFMRGNIYYHFFFWTIGYFIGASIFGAVWGVGPRFRVPMMPYIAILSSFGWLQIISFIHARKNPA